MQRYVLDYSKERDKERNSNISPMAFKEEKISVRFTRNLKGKRRNIKKKERQMQWTNGGTGHGV